MEQLVGYQNNTVYTFAIGRQAEASFQLLGKEICISQFPKDRPKLFWWGRVIR